MLMLAGLPLCAQEAVLETGFEQGIPTGFTLVCNDEMPVKGQYFNHITPVQTWFAGEVYSTDKKGVLSTSCRTYEMDTDNWLITPQLTLPENAVVQWTARAVHYHLRDGYKVMVSTTDTDLDSFEELFSVTEEAYSWTRHLVSLQAYAGKQVYIAIVHNSRSKFLLALDDLYVGQPKAADFIVEYADHPRFVGDVGTATLTGSVINAGPALASHSLECVTATGDTLDCTVASEGEWATGETLAYEINLPVRVGEVTNYKVEATDGTTRYTVWADSVICSHYPRTLFLEKATGTWCINCSDVISYIQQLEEAYGDQLVCAEAHGYYGDPLEYLPYVTGLQTMNFPTIFYNRRQASDAYVGNELASRVLTPTVAKVEAELVNNGNNTMTVTSEVTFAEGTGNSTGKYRVGYVIVEKTIPANDTLRQYGGNGTLRAGEYYYMKGSFFPKEVTFFHNVVRGMEGAFSGIKGSLPDTLEAKTAYTHQTTLEIPSTVLDQKQVAVIAIVMNYYTEPVTILNVAQVSLPEVSQSIDTPAGETEAGAKVSLWGDGVCRVTCAEEGMPFTLRLLSSDGRLLYTDGGTGSGEFRLADKAVPGICLVQVVTEGGSVVKKAVIREK